MAQQKKPGGPALDKKTELTFRTIDNLKSSTSMFQEFMKAASNYQKACLKMSEAGKALSESLQKISALQQSDVGDGIQRLAEIYKLRETKRDNLARTIQDDLINALQKSVKPEEAELGQFENDYKKVRDATRQQIAKLEANSKRAGKRGPEALKQAIASLNDKIKEADQIKADKLRNVLLLERKKYCNFLSQWGPVIAAEVDTTMESTRFKENESGWKALASSNQQLPGNMEDMIKQQQERTYVSLATEGSGSGSYADEYSYSGSGYDQGGDYGANAYDSGGLGTATALYDFAGEQADDLAFYAGDVITITKEDDGSGWLSGSLNGVNGIFPSSYVQRN